MVEKPQFLLKANDYLMRGVKGIIEGQHPLQQAIRRKVFEEYGYRFTKAVDRKFFRPDDMFYQNAQAVIDNKERGLTPIILGMPHSGFASGPLTAIAAGVVVEQTNLSGFYMTVASTLVDGKQGLPAYLAYQGWLPYLKAHHVEPMPIIRTEDEQLYTPREIQANALANRRGIMKFLTGSSGLTMFPEGGMDAGRTPKRVMQRIREKQAAGKSVPNLSYVPNNSRLAGIQKITDMRVIEMFIRLIEKKIQFQLWLTSVKNDEMIISPITKSVPLRALWEFVRPHPSIEVTLTAFAPLTGNDLVERIAEANGLCPEREVVVRVLRTNPDMLFDYIAGREVAPYIDWDRRGYYHTHAEKVLTEAGLDYYDKLPIPTLTLPV